MTFRDPVCADVELVSLAVDFEGGFSKLSVCGRSRCEMGGLRIRQIREDLRVICEVLGLGMRGRGKNYREKRGCIAMGVVVGLLRCFGLWFRLYESNTGSDRSRARTGRWGVRNWRSIEE